MNGERVAADLARLVNELRAAMGDGGSLADRQLGAGGDGIG